MNKVAAFIKKYWITFCIFAGLVFLYIIVTEKELVNPYLFPSTDAIKKAFADSKDMMMGNMLASFKLLLPSIIVSLIIALLLGTIMGMNKRIREILHPVIYAFSVIPYILLSPFVWLLAPDLYTASVFLIVY
ncbi:MAG: ABC transporter permease, partial [Lachnospiraceae bacterium]|nr:ABC transporter permease [Lachnospiraceae bacterium]